MNAPSTEASIRVATWAAALDRAFAPRRAGWVAAITTGGAVAAAVFLFARDASPWLVVFAVLCCGQAAADWHWRRFGAVFTPVRRLSAAGLLGACAAGMWFLLAFGASQQALQTVLANGLSGSVWEGLVPGLVWTLLPAGATALVVTAVVARRAFAHSVVEGRVAARAPHDIAWVGLVLGVAAFVAWGWHAAQGGVTQGLALFVAEGSTPLLVLFGIYAALRIWLYRDVGVAGPRLVLIDLRGPAAYAMGPARRLHAFATAWADRVGPVLIVRPARAAAAAAGNPARWAYAAGQSTELFVADAAAARRRIADWHAAGAAREVFVGAREALAPLCAELPQNPLRLLLVDAGSDAQDLAEARNALPKQRTLVWNDGGSALLRLAAVTGALAAKSTLFERLVRDAAVAPLQRRIGVVGRARSDVLADRLVAMLDQSEDSGGMTLDASRPPRGADMHFDELVLLLDDAWLDGNEAARVEVTALAAMAQGARVLSVVLTHRSAAAPERIVSAVKVCTPGAGSIHCAGPAGGDAELAALADTLRQHSGQTLTLFVGSPPATPTAEPKVVPETVDERAASRRVFVIARASEATAYAIGPLCEALGAIAPDIVVFNDYIERRGDAPDEWAARCATELADADLVVLLVGRDMDPGAGVDAELQSALALRKPLLPVLLDEARLPSQWAAEPVYAELHNRDTVQFDLLRAGEREALVPVVRAAEALLRAGVRRLAPRIILLYAAAPVDVPVLPDQRAINALLDDVNARPGDVALVPLAAAASDAFITACREHGVPAWHIAGDWGRALDAAAAETEAWDGEFTHLVLYPTLPSGPQIVEHLRRLTERLRARGANVHSLAKR